jgi:hypothetical protein
MGDEQGRCSTVDEQGQMHKENILLCKTTPLYSILSKHTKNETDMLHPTMLLTKRHLFLRARARHFFTGRSAIGRLARSGNRVNAGLER